MSSVPGRPDMTMTLEPSTVAVICSISRNTGSPAGPLPTTLIGKSTRTMLPLPAIVVKLGACRNTAFGTNFVGSLIRRASRVTAVSVAVRSSIASFNRSVYGAGHYATAGRSIPNNCLTIGVNDCCGAVPMLSNDANTFSRLPRLRHNAAAIHQNVPSVTSPD
jgi:hypothetical protein